MNKLPGFGLVERARALAPLIAREADEIERTRRLTQPVVSALIENGLYRALLPQSVGGAEAPPEIFMQMLEEIAKADASTAWCLGQCSVCAMIGGLSRCRCGAPDFRCARRHPGLGRDRRRGAGRSRRLSHHRALGFRQRLPPGELARRPCPGRRSRRHAGGCKPEWRAGNPHHPVSAGERHDVRRLGRDRPQRHRHRLLFGRKSVHSRKIRGACATNRPRVREKGPLYRLTTYIVFGLGFAAVSLGVARATLDAAIDLARGKASVGIKAMRENNAVQGSIGRTEGNLRAARAYLYATADEVWRDAEAHRRVSPRSTALALRLAVDLDHPSGRLGGRCRLSHGRRHRGVQSQQVRAPLPRHARHRAAVPGPRHPLRGRRQGDPGAPIPARQAHGRADAKQSVQASKPRAVSSDPAVEEVFRAYPKPLKAKLLALRRLIFDTAKTTKGVGALQETLKWGQPSYLTTETKSGSTIRIDRVKSVANQYAVYFHCQTDLVETFRELYPNAVPLWRQPQHPPRMPPRKFPNRSCATAWRWR